MSVSDLNNLSPEGQGSLFILFIFGGGGVLALAGIMAHAAINVSKSIADGMRARAARQLTADQDELWQHMRRAYEAQMAHQDWVRAVHAILDAQRLQGLPPPPEQVITLDDWPTLRQQPEEAIKPKGRTRKAATGTKS